jgi:Fe-S cluster assembly protein SufD
MMDFAEQFAAARDTLPGPAAMQTLRARSLDALVAAGLPTRRHENWRYTDLGFILERGFDLAGNRETARASLPSPASVLLLGQGPHIMFLDGHIDETLSDIPKDSPISVEPLTGKWASVAMQDAPGTLTAHPLGLLNTAFTREGAWITVPSSATASAPVTLLFLGTDAAAAVQQPRVVIDAGERSKASLVIQFRDLSPADSWTNIVTEVRLAPGATLDLTIVQEHSAAHYHTSLITAHLGRDADLRVGQFDLGGRMARSDIEIVLAEPGARAHVYGAALARDGRHVDTRVCVDHAAAHTDSMQTFRGIAGERSRSVFGGKVIVRPGAQQIAAHQRSDNLLLDKSAEIDTKPELEIYADDVKCSHGATVGELDEQHLFYLRARGIPAEEARALLTFAFANAVLRELGTEPLRKALGDRLAAQLPHPAGLEETP